MPGATRHGITTALDNDTAGRDATERAWHLLTAHAGIRLYTATLPNGADPGALITTPDKVAVLHAALTHARPLAQAVIDLRLDRLTTRHPDLLRWIEGRVRAARALADLITDLPVDQILDLTGYIAQRTNAGYDTVAEAVIANSERPPRAATTPMPRQTAARHHDVPRAMPPTGRRPGGFPPPGTPAAQPPPRRQATPDPSPPRRAR